MKVALHELNLYLKKKAMVVYVDAVRPHYMGNASKGAQRNGSLWCHLWTDGDYLELHELAQKIGLRQEWFQSDGKNYGTIYHLPHYDLVPSKRKLAIKHGAIEREVTELFAERRLAQNPQQSDVG